MNRYYTNIIWLLSLFSSLSINAQYTLSKEDVEFDASTGTITAYKWPEHAGTSIIIPNDFNGIKVKALGPASFYNLKFLADPTSGLTNVVIPSSVSEIGQSAFEYNQISSILLNLGLISIKKDAFRYNKLTEISFPNSVCLIDTAAFASNNISDISFPDELKTIHLCAFMMNSISTLDLPQSLEIIEEDAFYGNNISELNLPESLTYLNGFRENSFTQITIPSHVEEIGLHAFSYNPCKKLTIQNGVKKIGRFAFSTTWGVHYETNSLKQGQANDYSLEGIIEIPSSVKEIDDYAFENNGALTQVIFNDGVEKIGINAFAACGFTTVEIPETVKSIGDGAFRGNQIASLTLHDGLEEIKQEAFAQNQLTYVVIPGTVKRIGSRAFYGNSTMDEIILNQGVEIIGAECFSYNQSISSITFPTSLLEIEEKAFFNSFFVSVTLPTPTKEGKKFSHWSTYSGDVGNTVNKVVNLSGNDDLGYVAIFEDPATGIKEQPLKEIVYDSSVNNNFTINKSGKLEIFNMNGIEIYTKEIKANEVVNLSTIPAGLYIFVLNNNISGKFIKNP